MRELADYSGQFIPDLEMKDFSKNALVRLFYAASKMYIGMYGFWVSLIREKVGDEEARKLGIELWRRIEPSEIRWVSEALNIRGTDVAAYFKVWQVDPGFRGIGDLQFQLSDNNHGILTVSRCLSLEYAERHNDTMLQKLGCDADEELFPITAKYFNPRMRAVPLKVPPRKNKSEIACQWKVWIED